MKKLLKYYGIKIIPLAVITVIISVGLFLFSGNIVSLFIPPVFMIGSSAVLRIKNCILSNLYFYCMLITLFASLYYVWMLR